MRLTPEEQQQIKTIIAASFGEDAEVWLFGSRVDDKKRGGDVDLYVVPKQQDDLFHKRIKCLARLEDVLLYPVDLVVHETGRDLAVYRIALKTGVQL